MATSTDASPPATGGQLLLVLLQAVTTCLRTRRLSTLSPTITAGTVLPFAVWYGRGENIAKPLDSPGALGSKQNTTVD